MDNLFFTSISLFQKENSLRLDHMSIYENENFLVLNKKVFLFWDKIVFGCVKNFLFENKKLFEMRKNSVGNITLWKNFQKIHFLFIKEYCTKISLKWDNFSFLKWENDEKKLRETLFC